MDWGGGGGEAHGRSLVRRLHIAVNGKDMAFFLESRGHRRIQIGTDADLRSTTITNNPCSHSRMNSF